MTVLFHRYDHTHAAELRELLLDVHDQCYADSQSDFDTRERFADFLDGWSQRPGWDCVVGYDADQAAGFAYGAPLAPGTPWWAKVTPRLAPDFTRESGDRTFAVSEVMVRPQWRKTGTAAQIHEELLRARPEERATLFVNSDHAKVQALYEDWGYKTVGKSQPYPDSPLFTVMLRPLPHG
ncbi:GNAT family N-acetyltransferase [Streptomyces sp. NPDC001404]|uniref:GNAT family N-acetyltransferase n=1 Tax=Streptomyces sp. NPDC001404 TaxID=3364571 RepID=UPI0036B87EA0